MGWRIREESTTRVRVKRWSPGQASWVKSPGQERVRSLRGVFPILESNPGLAQDAAKEPSRDVLLMWIGNVQLQGTAHHEGMPPSGDRPGEAQRAETADQLTARDRPQP